MTAAVLIPSHKKVAWAWLDKLLGKKTTPREPAPAAAAMSPRERERVLERAYEEMKDELVRWIGAEIPAMRRQQAQIAHRHRLDPTFFDWFLIQGKNWPAMPQHTRDALRAIQKIFMFYAAVPDDWNDMLMPEMPQLRHRDAAMREFGDWFVKTVVRKIERQYVQMVHRKAQELVRVFRGRSGPRDPVAALLLMRDFEKRLVADRFGKHAAVMGVVDLFR